MAISDPIDFVLITALPEERDAVLKQLPGYKKLPPTEHDTHTYFQADLPVTFADDSSGIYKVIVMCLSKMGRVTAAAATVDAIQLWQPRYILLVGIAGGIAARDIELGDILISDQIVDYEGQKLTGLDPEIRWDVHRVDSRLLDACNNYEDETWHESIKKKRPKKGKSKCHTGPIASGDKVIAFGEAITKYREVWPKLIGVEMEAAGVATAAFKSNNKPGFFMIRAVSDLADENKNSKNVEKWREYACATAASFMIALLRSGPIPLMLNPAQSSPEAIGEIRLNLQDHSSIINFLATLLKNDPVPLALNPVQSSPEAMGEIRLNLQDHFVVINLLAALFKIEPGDIEVLRVYSKPPADGNEVTELVDKNLEIPVQEIGPLHPINIMEIKTNIETQEKHLQETKVLIVEDNEEWLKILTEIVMNVGFTPIPVDNLRSAQQVIGNTKIDIVVTDVFLGEADQGLWLLEDIQNLGSEVTTLPRIVVVSGSKHLGVRQTQKIFNHHDIVIGFISKEDFSEEQFQNILKKVH